METFIDVAGKRFGVNFEYRHTTVTVNFDLSWIFIIFGIRQIRFVKLKWHISLKVPLLDGQKDFQNFVWEFTCVSSSSSDDSI